MCVLQQRLDARGIVAHPWFQAQLPSTVICSDMGTRISGYQDKYRRKLKASIYGSFFVTSLRSMSAVSLTVKYVSGSVTGVCSSHARATCRQ